MRRGGSPRYKRHKPGDAKTDPYEKLKEELRPHVKDVQTIVGELVEELAKLQQKLQRLADALRELDTVSAEEGGALGESLGELYMEGVVELHICSMSVKLASLSGLRIDRFLERYLVAAELVRKYREGDIETARELARRLAGGADVHGGGATGGGREVPRGG